MAGAGSKHPGVVCLHPETGGREHRHLPGLGRARSPIPTCVPACSSGGKFLGRQTRHAVQRVLGLPGAQQPAGSTDNIHGHSAACYRHRTQGKTSREKSTGTSCGDGRRSFHGPRGVTEDMPDDTCEVRSCREVALSLGVRWGLPTPGGKAGACCHHTQVETIQANGRPSADKTPLSVGTFQRQPWSNRRFLEAAGSGQPSLLSQPSATDSRLPTPCAATRAASTVTHPWAGAAVRLDA